MSTQPAARTVTLRPVQPSDAAAFIAAARASRRFHHPWVSAPTTPDAFAAYLARFVAPHHRAYGVWHAGTGEAVGAIHLTNIVMGALRSGYLGYYAFAPHQGQGWMAQGLRTVLRQAFGPLGLHRVEANIQPGNAASIALVKACGFRLEGYSPRYLKIGGRWRDHERWAKLRP